MSQTVKYEDDEQSSGAELSQSADQGTTEVSRNENTTTVAIQADLVSTRDEMIPNHYDRTDPNPTIRDIRAELANG